MGTAGKYPVNLTMDYPDRALDKVTTFFRIFTAIPIWIIACLLVASSGKSMVFVILPTLLMILFRRKYPKWWFDWNLAVSHFLARVGAYTALMTDIYPSTDEEQAVHLTLPYPDAQGLNPWLPLVKWLLAIPHWFVLSFLNLAALVMVIMAWFAILFTGRFPKDFFTFLVGVARWNFRVMAYAFLLTTDAYPPFQWAE